MLNRLPSRVCPLSEKKPKQSESSQSMKPSLSSSMPLSQISIASTPWPGTSTNASSSTRSEEPRRIDMELPIHGSPGRGVDMNTLLQRLNILDAGPQHEVAGCCSVFATVHRQNSSIIGRCILRGGGAGLTMEFCKQGDSVAGCGWSWQERRVRGSRSNPSSGSHRWPRHRVDLRCRRLSNEPPTLPTFQQ